ncbi:MAG: aminotransferase class I/II-fold pyridoxal phosphate-dependent enzyme [Synergistaceae bacterium]|jgi:threonine aldolase|nr:aminotransferase class I/II-fold pyridoxal phosphate-dependent enzyme [Synergistaceae bacterium]
MYSFKNDYSETAHPRILQAIADTNLEQDEGYGLDRHSENARGHIARRLGKFADKADIHFLCGGTQANLTAISAFLRPHEAVVATEASHIAVHETGAIEATGHKILTVPTRDGKLLPEQVEEVLALHPDEHMVKPRLVKISQTTEIGAVYKAAELEKLSDLCRRKGLLLYVDGARMGSALTSEGSDATLEDLCRLADAFYIGGTKNGAMIGEAMVLCSDALKPDFRYHIKQKGGLLAKGRILGVQFEELFRDDLYFDLARRANGAAQAIAAGLKKAGFEFLTDSPSNQIFPILPDSLIEKLQKDWSFYVWKKVTATRSAVRLVTSWATTEEAVEKFVSALRGDA